MREITKPALVLFIITVITAALLGTVNILTKEPIKENKLKAENKAMSKVLPIVKDNNFSEKIIVEDKNFLLNEGTDIPYYYIGYNGENIVGYVITVKTPAYNEPMEILVGIDLEGKITGINLLEQKETPGLGANASNSKFTDQFIGKENFIDLTKSKTPSDTEISAVTSATITSRAVTNAVNEALALFKTIQEGAN